MAKLTGHGRLFTRFAVASLLLLAVGAKALSPVSELLSTRALVLLIAVEFAIAIGLVMDLAPRLFWKMSTGLFTAFAGVAVFKLWQGQSNCGCFGAIEVHPAIMLGVDVFVIGLLVAFMPSGSESGTVANQMQVAVYMLVIATFAPAVAYITLQRAPSKVGDGRASGFVTIEPREWLKKDCKLINFVPPATADRLREGDWLVILHRHDCDACRELLKKELRIEELKQLSDSEVSVALIEVPGNATVGLSYAPLWASVSTALQSSDTTWLVRTPVSFMINRGVVQQVFSDDALNRLFEDS